MTDNVAILDGYTVEVVASRPDQMLFLLVKPNTNVMSEYRAWDMDEQKYIRVPGWLFTTVYVKHGD